MVEGVYTIAKTAETQRFRLQYHFLFMHWKPMLVLWENGRGTSIIRIVSSVS